MLNVDTDIFTLLIFYLLRLLSLSLHCEPKLGLSQLSCLGGSAGRVPVQSKGFERPETGQFLLWISDHPGNLP